MALCVHHNFKVMHEWPEQDLPGRTWLFPQPLGTMRGKKAASKRAAFALFIKANKCDNLRHSGHDREDDTLQARADLPRLFDNQHLKSVSTLIKFFQVQSVSRLRKQILHNLKNFRWPTNDRWHP